MTRLGWLVKNLSEDEQDYLLDLFGRALVKCSQCVSSTDNVSTRLGSESRLAIKNIEPLRELLGLESKSEDGK